MLPTTQPSRSVGIGCLPSRRPCASHTGLGNRLMVHRVGLRPCFCSMAVEPFSVVQVHRLHTAVQPRCEMRDRLQQFLMIEVGFVFYVRVSRLSRTVFRRSYALCGGDMDCDAEMQACGVAHVMPQRRGPA